MGRLFNDQGTVCIPVRLSEAIMPGVVSLPEGARVELDPAGVDVAGSANMLTATDGTAPAATCIMHGIAVEATRRRAAARRPTSPR